MNNLQTHPGVSELSLVPRIGGADPAFSGVAGGATILITANQIQYEQGTTFDPLSEGYKLRAKMGHIHDQMEEFFSGFGHLTAIGVEGFDVVKEYETIYGETRTRRLQAWSDMMYETKRALAPLGTNPNFVKMYDVGNIRQLISFNRNASKVLIADIIELMVEGDIERVEGHHITDAIAVAVMRAYDEGLLIHPDEMVLDLRNFEY